MQPIFGIAGERFQKAVDRLRELRICGGDDVHLYPVLFLCGFHYQKSHWKQKDLGIGHIPEDGLNEAARQALKVLAKFVKSRKMKAECAAPFHDKDPNKEHLALALAFLEFMQLGREFPLTLIAWVERGDRATNLLRLSFGMGAISLFEADVLPFIHALVKKPLGFGDGAGNSRTAEVFQVIKSFTWSEDTLDAG
jgi:hypothetical protein